MKKETFGVMKWMQQRYSNADSYYLIHRYGTVNGVVDDGETSFIDKACDYIQESGFTLFTAWLLARKEVKKKRGQI